MALTLPYLTLPYLTLPYLTIPYLTLTYLTIPYLTAGLWCRARQVLGTFYDEGLEKHVLAMQAADSHGELVALCRRGPSRGLLARGHAQQLVRRPP